jgi:hypothetical protein
VVRRFVLRAVVVVAGTTWMLAAPGCLADRRSLLLAGTEDGGGADGGGDANPGRCDPVRQTGCAVTQKCTVDDNGAPTCVPDGSKGTRTTCTPSPDSCVKGNYCASIGGGGTMCRQFCERQSDCTQPPPTGQPTNEAYCAFAFTDGASVRLCSTPCNPAPYLGPSGCPNRIRCNYGNLGGVLITDCQGATGGGLYNDPCTTSDDCDDGYTCITSLCRPFCRTGYDADCGGGGYTCESGGGGAAFGVCCPPGGC